MRRSFGCAFCFGCEDGVPGARDFRVMGDKRVCLDGQSFLSLELNPTGGEGYPMIELCRHIKPEGTACKGPVVRGTKFCRHHQLIKNTLDKVKPSIENNALFKPLPFHFPEDRSAIQTNLFLVINAFNRRRIDSKAASVMIYGLQVCLSNLNKGPLAPTDAEDTVRRVILTPDGDEIAPPANSLKKTNHPSTTKTAHASAAPSNSAEHRPSNTTPTANVVSANPSQMSCHPDRSAASANQSQMSCHPDRSPCKRTEWRDLHLKKRWVPHISQRCGIARLS